MPSHPVAESRAPSLPNRSGRGPTGGAIGSDRPLSGETAIWIVLLLVVVGALLRFHDIDAHGLWGDELFSAATATTERAADAPFFEVKMTPQVRLGDSFWTQKGADVHPPLLEVVLLPWMAMFGRSELAVRFPAFLASVLFLPVVFVGMRRLAGTLAALFALTSVALSPALIVYAKDARQYSFLVLFSGVAALQAIDAVASYRAGSRPRAGWGRVAVLLLMSMTHYYGVALAVVIGLGYALLALRGRDGASLLRLATIPASVAAWMVVSRGGLRWIGEGINRWHDFGPADLVTRLLPETFAYSYAGLTGPIYVIAVVAALVVERRARRATGVETRPEESGRASGSMLSSALVVLAAYLAIWILICVYTVRSGAFNPRFTLHVLVALHFAGAIALARLPGPGWPKLLALAAVCVLGLSQRELSPWYEEYREASQHIADRVAPGDVIVGSWAPNLKYYDYYLREMVPEDRYDLRGFSETREMSELCEEARRRPAPFAASVFVFYPKTEPTMTGAFLDACSGTYRLEERRAFRGVSVDRIVRSPD